MNRLVSKHKNIQQGPSYFETTNSKSFLGNKYQNSKMFLLMKNSTAY